MAPEDVVLGDEGIRVCRERRTTSGPPPAPWPRKTWCSVTKEQGFAGSGAPRPARRRRHGPRRRGARRRRNKGLRGATHHVRPVTPRAGPTTPTPPPPIQSCQPRCRRHGPGRRGARRRRNKGLRGAAHHVRPVTPRAGPTPPGPPGSFCGYAFHQFTKKV